MNSRLVLSGILLVLGAMVLSSCGTIQAQEPTVAPIDDSTSEAVEIPPQVLAARDAALARAGAPELDWIEENITPGWPEAPVPGWMEYRFTAEGWEVTVGYAVVAPEQVVYQVAVTGTDGVRWEGEVDAQGQVTEQFVANEEGGGQVEPSTPTAGEPAVAWYGYVASTPDGAQYDDYLVLMPEGIGREIGIEGADEAIEAQIIALRDHPEPGKYAHFWGTFTCDVIDYGGCQLLVTRLRVDGPGPFFDPDPVEGWEGTIVSGPEGPRSGGDDCLVLSTSQFMVEYGIDSTDPELSAEIAALRDTGIIVRVWGQVSAGVMDWSGTQIQVERIEASREPPAADAYEGWVGHFNYQFGYGFLYPSDLTVLEDQDGNVNISGPLVDNERWPCIAVSTYESEFYLPPAGTDVTEWVTGFGMPYDEIETGLEIAGLPAVHLKTYASPMAYAYDEYYFIQNDRLFRIAIVHCGPEDWELYTNFLEGFEFPHAP